MTTESKKQILAQRLAVLVSAWHNCAKKIRDTKLDNGWADRHEAKIKALVKDHLPSGSGFDDGTTLVVDNSDDNVLSFVGGYHHMDGNGSYCGWSSHVVTVSGNLAHGFTVNVVVTGAPDDEDYDADHHRDYVAETFCFALQTLVEV